MMSLNPVQVLRGGAEEEKAETARLSSFVGAIAIGDLIKSTLGPKGMDKILVSIGRNEGSIEVTNDGATILKSISVDNPAAKLLQDISKVQDNEVGDGTTSVTVLAAELLKEAETLVNMKIHPQTIIAGWRRAVAAARSALTEAAQNHSSDPARFKDDLLKIAGTTLGSKILSQYKGQFALLAVDAVLRLKGSTNLRSIQLIKKAGGTLSDSYLEEGFLLDKSPGLNQPRRVEKAKILIANTPMDTDKIKVFGSRVQVDSVAKIAELELAEKEKMKDKVDKILKHGMNVFVNRQLIYNYPEQLFADAGVMAIEHADFDGIERLALVTGGEIVSTFDHPEMVKLGTCDLIEEVRSASEKWRFFLLSDSCGSIAELELAEKEKMKDKVDKILKHGMNVFVNRQLIYNYPEQLFADAGVMAIEHADFDGIERLALVTGGEIVSTFDHPEMVKLGTCDLIEEVMIGEDTLLRFSGVPLGEACSIVIRGATQQILDEAERSLHDALCVLSQTVKEPRVVYGGGCSEMLMAQAVYAAAATTPGKEAVAMEAFARALIQLPTIIADNGGFDSAQLMSELRAAHTQGQKSMGLDMIHGKIGDMAQLGIVESFQV
ncbi:unnamed protein product, partial [Cyprideis torosa]